MKYYRNLIQGIVLVGAFLITIPLFSQDYTNTIIDPLNPGSAVPLPTDNLEDSCAFILDLGLLNLKNSNKKQALTIEIINFDSRYKLLPSYVIDGIEYCDNGNYNDKIAGDGLFTSVTTHRVSTSKSSSTVNIFQGKNFQYTNELASIINSKYDSETRSGIMVGCSVRIVTCPETSWYNSCWPFSSPCSCLEFYDCKVGLEIDF
jgi:hypothetical protein